MSCFNQYNNIALMNLTALTNVGGVYVGYNNTIANYSIINISGMGVTNNTTFSIFGSQNSFTAMQIIGSVL